MKKILVVTVLVVNIIITTCYYNVEKVQYERTAFGNIINW